MKFSTVFVVQLLAWNAAGLALPVQDNNQARNVKRADDTISTDIDLDLDRRFNSPDLFERKKTDKKTASPTKTADPTKTTSATSQQSTETNKPNSLTPMEKELIDANKKGVKAYDVPKPPAKGQKVTKRSSRSVQATTLDKRLDPGEADMNDVAKGTASDSVFTRGLAPCSGIVAVFSGVSNGKINKIVAHIGPLNGQTAISKMTKEVYDAAVEGGIWDDKLDEGHRPEIFVSHPDVSAEVDRMVKQGDIRSEDRKGMEKTLNDVNKNIETAMKTVCSVTGGKCFFSSRNGVQRLGSVMKSPSRGDVNVDGVALQRY